MKLHITITDNETGETIVDQDTRCIIGAYDCDSVTASFIITRCTKAEKVATACGALKAAVLTIRQEPKKVQRLARKLVRKSVLKVEQEG